MQKVSEIKSIADTAMFCLLNAETMVHSTSQAPRKNTFYPAFGCLLIKLAFPNPFPHQTSCVFWKTSNTFKI